MIDFGGYAKKIKPKIPVDSQFKDLNGDASAGLGMKGKPKAKAKARSKKGAAQRGAAMLKYHNYVSSQGFAESKVGSLGSMSIDEAVTVTGVGGVSGEMGKNKPVWSDG